MNNSDKGKTIEKVKKHRDITFVAKKQGETMAFQN